MKKPRQLIIFAIIIVVVIGLSATAAILLSQKRSTTDQAKNSTTPSVPQTLPSEKKADAADKLAYEGDVAGGVQQLDDAIKGTTDKHEQFVYYSRKATLLFNNGDLAGALDAAKKAYELENTSDSAAFVGQIALQKGDKTVALDYYKKAIDHIDPTDPFAKKDTQYYQSTISGLESNT